MRKTTVAVILSYVTVVLLVLGTVGILFGIGYIQQMRGMYREDFTGIRLGGLFLGIKCSNHMDGKNVKKITSVLLVLSGISLILKNL